MATHANGCNHLNDDVRSDAMHALAALALVTALNKTPPAATLANKPIVCAPNSDVSSSGCGNVGPGNSGWNNTGSGNSGSDNVGNGNSGHNNVGDGNSGCGNTGIANSGAGNVGVGLSGGTGCGPVTVVTNPPPTTPGTTIPGAPLPTETESATLPLTGSSTAAPLALATGLMMSGVAAVTLANRRRRFLAVARTDTDSVPLSEALGLLLTGKRRSS